MARRLGLVAVTAAALGLVGLPAALVYALGWQDTSFLNSPLGKGTDVFVALALVYSVWVPAGVAGLVWVYDRLDYHYAVHDRPQRLSRRERRRARAALRLGEAEAAAGREVAQRRRSRPNDREHERG